MVAAADLDDPLQRGKLALERRHGLGQIRRHEAHPGARMAQDVGELATVQPGIGRHHGEPGMPAGEQQLEVVGDVAHDQGSAIARRQAEALAQRPGDRGRALHQGVVGEEHVRAQGHGWPVGAPAARTHEQVGDVHRRTIIWRRPSGVSDRPHACCRRIVAAIRRGRQALRGKPAARARVNRPLTNLWKARCWIDVGSRAWVRPAREELWRSSCHVGRA